MTLRQEQRSSPKLSLNCIECRKRKVKCDRGNPCSNCKARGSICRNEVLRKPDRSRTSKALNALRYSTDASLSSNKENPFQSGGESDEVIRRSYGTGSESLRDISSSQQINHTSYTQIPLVDLIQPVQNLTHPLESTDMRIDSQGLDDILFSNEILVQLFGNLDEMMSMDSVKDGVGALPSSFSNISAIPPVNAAPVHDTLCISRLNRDAGSLSAKIIEEYKELLPQSHQIDTIVAALRRRTSLSSTRSDLNTILDTSSFMALLYQHEQRLQLPSTSKELLPACEVFYVACALFYAYSLDPSSKIARERYLPFLITLNKHMTGLEPSLMLIQACRLWSMGCTLCNDIEEAASGIMIGGRAAISMGLHKSEMMMKQPTQQRPFFTDALVNFVCDSCILRAVFAIETPISPACLDPLLFNLSQDDYDKGSEKASTERTQKPMPLILRLHASSWIFIGRYYREKGRLRVPIEENLTPPFPVDEAETYEISQLGAISTILHHCALELERPLSSWLSAVSFQKISTQQQINAVDSDNTVQSNRALHMLYLIRYYRILINYPFIRIKQDSREAVMEAARSTINTTWRLARQGGTHFQDNLALYGRICLRAISFLAACRLHQRGTDSHQVAAHDVLPDRYQLGPDKDEQILADLELGVDALDKLDILLDEQISLASLASAHLLKTSASGKIGL